MTDSFSITIERAKVEDVEDLMRLYQIVYGSTYPIKYGTDPDVARDMISSAEDRWYVAREPISKKPVASLVFDVDTNIKIGRLLALVVHPDFAGHGLAGRMVEEGSQDLLSQPNGVNSLYATTRTNTIGPQLIFIKNKFLPLGIFPNSHKLREYETLALFARFRPGVLERRRKLETVPEELAGLLNIIQQRYQINSNAQFFSYPKNEKPYGPRLEFELINAPEFVYRRFESTFNDPYDRFYPFHKPNFLVVSTNGEVEIYANFSKQDRYCAIVALNVPIYSLAGRLSGLIDRLKEQGISYIEILVGLEHGRSIATALDAGFVPSAIYPAMRESETGQMEDFVVLSRTMEPLNFRGLSIDNSFRPFVDHYVLLWKKQALETLEFFDGSR